MTAPQRAVGGGPGCDPGPWLQAPLAVLWGKLPAAPGLAWSTVFWPWLRLPTLRAARGPARHVGWGWGGSHGHTWPWTGGTGSLGQVLPHSGCQELRRSGERTVGGGSDTSPGGTQPVHPGPRAPSWLSGVWQEGTRCRGKHGQCLTLCSEGLRGGLAGSARDGALSSEWR